MLIVPAGVKVHLALGYTDMRKGMDRLAMPVQTLKKDPFSGPSVRLPWQEGVDAEDPVLGRQWSLLVQQADRPGPLRLGATAADRVPTSLPSRTAGGQSHDRDSRGSHPFLTCRPSADGTHEGSFLGIPGTDRTRH